MGVGHGKGRYSDRRPSTRGTARPSFSSTAECRFVTGVGAVFDAGSITVRTTFDADGNFTGEEVTALHGPHPGFFLENRCSALTEALGL